MFKGIYYLFFPEHDPNYMPRRIWTRPTPDPVPPVKTVSDYPSDAELRGKYTSVQDAWDQYQMLIKLHGGLSEEERNVMYGKERRRTRPLPR